MRCRCAAARSKRLRQHRVTDLAILGCVLLGSTCMKRVASESSDPNEAVLYAADRVRTLNPQQPLAEALLVRWGKVLEVGARRDLESAHPAVRVVELRDATIVPGLADAHGHLASLGRSLSILSFVGASSVEQILEMAKNAPPASYEGE